MLLLKTYIQEYSKPKYILKIENFFYNKDNATPKHLHSRIF